jgi:hypothetical protein
MLTRHVGHQITGKPSKALLLASLGTACCLPMPWAIAVNFVTNCNDQGVGSLREAILEAPENGVVDATGLANVCSLITVKTGDIQVAVNDLTILGPGADALSISARNGSHQYYSRIFNHTGSGTLKLENLSVTRGWINNTGNQSLYGGCIYSKGNVSLIQSTVSGCLISSEANAPASGGGIDARGKVYLLNSQVTHNTVTGVVFVSGGGIASVNFEAHEAVISDNTLFVESDSNVRGGGLYLFGTIDIENTTISGNAVLGGSHAVGGGVDADDGTITVRNSTISSNTSDGNAGGIFVLTNGDNMTLLNSTIAFNHSGQDNAAGAAIFATNFYFESNILANNTWGSAGASYDLQTTPSGTLTGSHNLVFATSSNVPADTLIGRCPQLGPLGNNGGATPTHALLSRSPAIDAGSNPVNLSNDQRGPPFLRTLGSGTDIGSYEVNPADIIFNSGFDGC